MDETTAFYSRPTYDQRGGFNPFAGSRRQRGGGIFGSLARMFLPAVKNLGKSLLQQGASHGLGMAKDVMGDVSQGKSLKDAFVKRGKARAKLLGRDVASRGMTTLRGMIGKGGRRALRKRKRRTKSTPRRSRSTQSRKRKSKKRRPKSSHTRAKKRRRVNF